MKRIRGTLVTLGVLGAMVVPVAGVQSAQAHGWVTDPPSRQDYCSTGSTSFDCGAIQYEPQSVEAPKGSLKCSGGNEQFAILDDESKDWPVKDVSGTVDVTWNNTARHATSSWEYFVDGDLFQTFDGHGEQPPATMTQTLTGLPSGEHTILARWNVADTGNAFYSCMDVNVDGQGSTDPTDPPTDPTDPPAQDCAVAWAADDVYQADDAVSHDGHEWVAKWWTTGDEPGTTGEWGVWDDQGSCDDSSEPGEPEGGDGDGDGDDGDDNSEPTEPTDPIDPGTPDDKVVGYFTDWGIYDRDYQVKDVEDSGSADKLTHLLYAFGNVTGGECKVGDPYADYRKTFTADESVSGEADTWDQELRGNFNQLRELKELHPDLKILWSFGGWTWSGGFGDAAANPEQFADSCYDLVNDSRWADVFDGIDIDWEYPNDCGLSCDESGENGFPDLMEAVRDRFDDELVTAAISADGTDGGKLDAADYASAAQDVDFYMPMTYDYFGAWDKKGPTAPHSPLTGYGDMPIDGFDATTTITKLREMGVPSEKLLLGIGFYGRGWTGVDDAEPGGSATGPAQGTYEDGIEDYKVLVDTCPPTGTVGGTSYAYCDGDWWSYDTPETISDKMEFAKDWGLGGSFFWELSGDTDDGDLISAISDGLS